MEKIATDYKQLDEIGKLRLNFSNRSTVTEHIHFVSVHKYRITAFNACDVFLVTTKK